MPRVDKRLLGIAETDGCTVDGIIAATGCHVGGRTLRWLAARAVTVEWAARIHRVPLAEFLEILDRAVATKQDQKER